MHLLPGCLAMKSPTEIFARRRSRHGAPRARSRRRERVALAHHRRAGRDRAGRPRSAQGRRCRHAPRAGADAFDRRRRRAHRRRRARLLVGERHGRLAARHARQSRSRAFRACASRPAASLMCNDSETDPRVDLRCVPAHRAALDAGRAVAVWRHDHRRAESRRAMAERIPRPGRAHARASQHADWRGAEPCRASLVGRGRVQQQGRSRPARRRGARRVAPAHPRHHRSRGVRALRSSRFARSTPARSSAYEALARFSDGRPRPPDRWFDDAARADLGFELEVAVMRKALLSLRACRRNTYLAVNVSPETAASPEISAAVRAPRRRAHRARDHRAFERRRLPRARRACAAAA